MILQALCGYYNRLLKAGESVALLGYARVGVSSCIVIDSEGNVKSVRSLKQEQDKKLVPTPFIVPEPPKRSGTRPEPNFLCENPDFLFGIYKDEKGARYRFNASAARHAEILGGLEDEGAQAILRFFEKRNMGSYAVDDVDTSSLDDGGNIIFELQGDSDFLHVRPAIKRAWEQYREKQSAKADIGQCLVTGKSGPVARVHNSIGGFGQDKPTLVCFDKKSFRSYGKKQGLNAPVSEVVAFQYTTALSSLMKDRLHHIRLHGDTVVFWAEDAMPIEESLAAVFLSSEARVEDIELDEVSTEKIRGILASLYKGKLPIDSELNLDARFYILGMTINKTRLVIRFFHVASFGNLLERVRQHYEDLVVVGDHKVPSIYRILLETAVRRDSDNVAPGLERALMQSILLGTNYPYSLYQAMLRRIRAEGGQDPKKLKGYPINAVRVGILKGYLNRKNRINNRKERMTMALNPDERDKGYLLGRLFAVLEKAQKDALGNVNASIVDKYLNSALATPQMVFPMLLTLSKKHNAKSGSFYNDRLTGEIVNQLPSSGFPISLNPEEQGRFIIGYYHQNVSLYTPKVHRAKDDVSADANENNPN